MSKKFGESGIKFLLSGLGNIFQKITDAVKSVNGVFPDETGDITIDTVPYADNMRSDSSQRTTGAFINRTTGGGSSVSGGDAWLMKLLGNIVHDGFVAEQLEMNVNSESITATIDRDTFVAYVASSGTITLVYSSSWSADPALYGVTVDGTPTAGDSIVIDYVKEERGTISVATPTGFVSTGWNLFNSTEGYARVVKYAYGYRVDGTYSELKYAATPTGAQSSITVTNNNFDIPADGYVFVTGGDSSTAIYPVWEDWTEGYPGDLELYTASVVDLSAVMTSYFTNGLLKAGNIADEIDLNLGQAISRVERLEYTAENLATAKASGRAFEYDENYIYLAKATATVNTISVSGAVSSDDHGIEYFTGSDVAVSAEILYGINLKNRLERDVPTLSQPLNAAQQAQFLANIGAQEAMVFSDITSSAWTWGQAYVTGDNPSVSFLSLGRFRMLRFTITPKSTQTTWTTIGTIAAGHRPPHYMSTYGIESNANPTPKHIRIKPDGTCEIFARGTATYSANLMWFV